MRAYLAVYCRPHWARVWEATASALMRMLAETTWLTGGDQRQICFRPSPIRVQKVNIDVTSSSTLNQDLSLVFDLQLARSRNLERWQRLFAIRSSRAALTFIVDHPIPLQIRPHHSRWVSKVSQPASLLVVRPLTHASRLDRSTERACSTSDEGP